MIYVKAFVLVFGGPAHVQQPMRYCNFDINFIARLRAVLCICCVCFACQTLFVRSKTSGLQERVLVQPMEEKWKRGSDECAEGSFEVVGATKRHVMQRRSFAETLDKLAFDKSRHHF